MCRKLNKSSETFLTSQGWLDVIKHEQLLKIQVYDFKTLFLYQHKV